MKSRKLIKGAIAASVLVVVVAIVASFGLGNWLGPDTTEATPSGKVYSVWVSASFGAPPFAPFQDCFRFNADGTFEVDLAGGPGGTWFEISTGTITLWKAEHPAGGLALVFAGPQVFIPGGSGGDAIGAIGTGQTEGTAFGVEGMMDPGCSVLGPENTGGSPWAK